MRKGNLKSWYLYFTASVAEHVNAPLHFDPAEINDDHCNSPLLELGFQFFIPQYFTENQQIKYATFTTQTSGSSFH